MNTNRYIRIEWPELETEIRARLADDQNPTLCKFFWDKLPIHILQTHAFVSGDTLLAFHPYTKEIEPEYAEDFLDERYWGEIPSSVGYVGFKTSGYQAIVIQWGPERSEFEKRVPVAYVEPEDLEKLAVAGKKIFEGILKGKIHTIRITRIR